MVLMVLIIFQKSVRTLPSSNDKASGFDFGAGLFYKSEKVYIGLSSTHINEPVIESTTELITMNRHYYLSAGYQHDLNDKMILKPSLFVKSDGVSSTRLKYLTGIQ